MQSEFTLDIKEEYLLDDLDTCDQAQAPAAQMRDFQNHLQGQVNPEFMSCQIEVGTRVCPANSVSRDDLKRLRAGLSRHASKHNQPPNNHILPPVC